MRIALGSSRAAKVEAVRSAAVRIASIDSAWADPIITALDVETDAPAMPLNDTDLMRGARARALAVRELLLSEAKSADIWLPANTMYEAAREHGESFPVTCLPAR